MVAILNAILWIGMFFAQLNALLTPKYGLEDVTAAIFFVGAVLMENIKEVK